MNSTTSIARSGLQVASLSLSAAASNIANLGTEGFQRNLVISREASAGGVSASVVRSPLAGEALAEDLVGQKLAQRSFEANLRVLQTSDRMIGRLLDVFA